MKIPKNLSASDLIKSLEKLGYFPTRQKGSHIRLSSNNIPQHHITIPNHRPIKIGTLNSILNEICENNNLTKSELIHKLFS